VPLTRHAIPSHSRLCRLSPPADGEASGRRRVSQFGCPRYSPFSDACFRLWPSHAFGGPGHRMPAVVAASRGGVVGARGAVSGGTPVWRSASRFVCPGATTRSRIGAGRSYRALSSLDRIDDPQAFGRGSRRRGGTTHKLLRRRSLAAPPRIAGVAKEPVESMPSSHRRPPGRADGVTAVYRSSNDLPAPQRIALVLRRIEGASQEEGRPVPGRFSVSTREAASRRSGAQA